MYVTGLGTAHPPGRYTKAACLAAFRQSTWYDRLNRRARMVAEKVLSGDNGIEARRLAVDSLTEVFHIDPDTLHARFLAHAPKLAAEAASAALADAGIVAADADGLVVSTCTGYLCPGLSGYVIEQLGLRRDLKAFDLVGHGCAAALPNWQIGQALLDSGQCRHVVSVCVEVSSAAMFLDNDPGVMISACLFGDGAGAAVLSRAPEPGMRAVQCRTIGSLIDPDERAALRFEHCDGMLRNILTRGVPKLAAARAERVFERVLCDEGIDKRDIGTWILHAGGRDVLAAVQHRIGLTEHHVRYSSEVLREFGNLSSAFVYFVLRAALDDGAPGGWWWMASFGAGFACHGALLEVA